MDFYDDNQTEVQDNSTGFAYNDFVNNASDDPFVGAVPATDENTLLMKVFKWMFAGLGVSAVSAYVGMYILFIIV